MARAGLTAERVTEAAADLADAVGFENITVSALARIFGVKDPSLYSHVKNLQDLRERVALLAAGELADRIAAGVAGRAGKEAMVAFANAYREYALAHPGRYAATQAVQLDPAVLAASPVHVRTVELTHAMLRAYKLVEPDLTDAGRLLRSAFHGYITLEANGGFRHSREVQRSWERALDGLHVMLENWPADPSRRAVEGEGA
ncbi:MULTISPECIES: TetR/AcrR family transcriptional regulator [Streptosporangium]|uniref:AcrR family transcriptional regulator n=1 Tax=Streptosporangium brasiliense TaxID=47480 RepID=A0ABT9RHK1_9ACTN|nr:TetR/AcrR family transcriptional regulator [Streptosporangium brasiliense]MDP9868204.1 AcrR family transcriptional regulator [Streptosporangium brasiliense]